MSREKTEILWGPISYNKDVGETVHPVEEGKIYVCHDKEQMYSATVISNLL